MGLITKVYNFIANTPAQSAQVNNDLDTIYSEFNGNISDPNIHPSATIQQSKIQNLPQSFTALTNAIATINNALGVTLNTVAIDVGEPEAQAVGEQQLYVPIFVAANSLASSRYLFLSQDFAIYISPGANCTLKYYYGGVVFFTPIITNSTGTSQLNVAVHVDVTLHARNSTQAQIGIGRMFLQSTNTLLFTGAPGVYQNLNITGLVVDSTVDQMLQMNVYWDTPGNALLGFGSACWMVK